MQTSPRYIVPSLLAHIALIANRAQFLPSPPEKEGRGVPPSPRTCTAHALHARIDVCCRSRVKVTMTIRVNVVTSEGGKRH